MYTRGIRKLDVQQQCNEYAEIVGEGPFGKNQTRYRALDELGAAPRSPVYEDSARNVECAPYFDPEDTRNDGGLRSPRKDDPSAAFAARNVNETVNEGVIDKSRTAAAKQGAGNTDRSFSATLFDEPNVFSKPKSLFKTLTTPTKFKSK